MKCPCGEIFDSHRLEENLIHVPHISAAQARILKQSAKKLPRQAAHERGIGPENKGSIP
jgi:hypothetical protein